MRIANSIESLVDFLEEIGEVSKFQLEEIPLLQQGDWLLGDGALSHRSGGFFHVVGVVNRKDPDDELLMLYQPQSALTGIILHRSDQDIHMLLQARVEPGNTGVVQYGPTIQSTPANYLKLHGGRATSYIDQFTQFRAGTQLITHSMQLDLGLRYFQKSKSHHYLEVEHLLETEQNMVWASLGAVRGLLHESNVLNADLRSLLSVFDWDGYTGLLPGLAESARVSSGLPMVELAQPGAYRMLPLEQLRGWRIGNEGVVGLRSGAATVSMYKFTASTREVGSWNQPLYRVSSLGLVQLALRKKDALWECLLTVGSEPGLSTTCAVYPSLVVYPGEDALHAEQAFDGKVIAEMIQCDEGGRFFQNDSRYQVLLVESDAPVRTDQAWVPVAALRVILQSSDQATFQLRCISSMILDLLASRTFAS